MSKPNYIPALRFHWFVPKFYDTLLYLFFPERKVKQAFINQMRLNGNETILDFGCGTGTLSIMIKKEFHSVSITGIDVDENMIAFAEKKIKAKGLNIPLKKYDGENIPFVGNQQYDKVVSSFVFHHLPTIAKRKLLPQLCRTVKPGGELHIADFGKPANFFIKIGFALLRKLDGKENTQVNAEGLLPDFIKGGGFNDVQLTKSYNTVFGTVDLIKATC